MNHNYIDSEEKEIICFEIFPSPNNQKTHECRV